MGRGKLIGVLVVAGVAGIALLGWRLAGPALRRVGGREPLPQARQWDFERDELVTLMDRVVDEQRQRVEGLEEGSRRERARAFLEYYEGRRAAVR